ncbi:MAG: SPOR domain-containing protein [Novosphingobium sp.]|nr:SPOR domain-containing protein [Novosphingobium sp.]
MRTVSKLAVVAALAVAAPALADVKDGVDAWTQGDYAAAVAQWKGPAAQGDADAQYNLAQAYRLGRGVPRDAQKAEELYAKAAAAGHPLAADNYGLMLFQQGRRAEAIPYLRDAVGRGDPRAQYLLGLAYFNGDFVEKDWVRAYALLTLANGQGLPQAAPAIAQMDGFVPLAQRQEAAALATRMQQEADATRAQQLASADLASGIGTMPEGPGPAAATPKVPHPIESVPVDPSVAAAQAAVAEAARVTGTESPATAGADYARPQVAGRPQGASSVQIPVAGYIPDSNPGPVLNDPAPAVRPAPAAQPAHPAASPAPVARPVAPRAVPAPAPAPAAADGPWRVQLGAFSVSANAERLWQQLGGKGVLAGKRKILEPEGKLTKLQAGGFATRADADAACAALKRGGQGCIVTR